ncbi:Zinc finger MYM-type protein 1 [Merluccius polli]|uniref:Zinc finger MYM-type protein 1 n=1 Tax=Merluccius polli TaxID=89951 RepID=A0AA47MVC3_MERPO|nr:Zinc finger MYM-type protein 1 [Merluccius polli]
MSGKHSGVQARIKEVAKLAFYIHCNAHCLNLVLVDTVRGIAEAECFFSLLKQLYIYMSGSAVHPKWLQVQQEMYTGAPRELQVLSDTRWASRYYACRNLWDRLPAVVKVLEELCDDHSGERSVGARGLLPQIDFQFIVFLAIFKKLLGDAKLLSDMLQSSSLDLAKAVDLVEALISTFESYRSEQVFDDLWDTVLELAKQCDVSIDTAPKRKRTLQSSKLKGYHVLSTVGSQETGNGKDYYRTGMFNLVLDRMLSELRNRFSNQNCDIMRGIQALNPSSKSFCDKDSLFAFAKLYGCDLVDLEHELYQIKRVLDQCICDKVDATGFRSSSSQRRRLVEDAVRWRSSRSRSSHQARDHTRGPGVGGGVAELACPPDNRAVAPTTLVIGDSIVRHVRMRGAFTMAFPGATVADITGKIPDILSSYPQARRIIIHAGANDIARQQSELLKQGFINLFNSVSQSQVTVFISGPTPTCGRGIGSFSRLLSLNTWLSSVCSSHQCSSGGSSTLGSVSGLLLGALSLGPFGSAGCGLSGSGGLGAGAPGGTACRSSQCGRPQRWRFLNPQCHAMAP